MSESLGKAFRVRFYGCAEGCAEGCADMLVFAILVDMIQIVGGSPK